MTLLLLFWIHWLLLSTVWVIPPLQQTFIKGVGIYGKRWQFLNAVFSHLGEIMVKKVSKVSDLKPCLNILFLYARLIDSAKHLPAKTNHCASFFFSLKTFSVDTRTDLAHKQRLSAFPSLSVRPVRGQGRRKSTMSSSVVIQHSGPHRGIRLL